MTKPADKADPVFDPVGHDPLPDRVAHQIETHILNGILREGMRLPGERDLAEQMDVSRPKLREALALLEERGLIQTKAGEGTVIAPLSGPAMTAPLIALFTRHPEAVDDHLEYRRHQEAFAARLAAERSTRHDDARIARTIDAMEAAHRAQDGARAAEADSDFHMAIVEASFNRTLIHTMTALYALNRQAHFFSRTELLTGSTVAADLLDQHRGIAAAIAARTPDQAERQASAHIDYVRDAMRTAMAARERDAVSRKRGLGPR